MSRVLRGRNLTVKIGSAVIPLSTGCRITVGTSTIDSTTKDDPEDWADDEILMKNWSVSNDGYMAPSDADASLVDTLISGAQVDVSFSIGSSTYEGKAAVTNVDYNGQVKQNATVGYTFTGQGALAKK